MAGMALPDLRLPFRRAGMGVVPQPGPPVRSELVPQFGRLRSGGRRDGRGAQFTAALAGWSGLGDTRTRALDDAPGAAASLWFGACRDPHLLHPQSEPPEPIPVLPVLSPIRMRGRSG